MRKHPFFRVSVICVLALYASFSSFSEFLQTHHDGFPLEAYESKQFSINKFQIDLESGQEIVFGDYFLKSNSNDFCPGCFWDSNRITHLAIAVVLIASFYRVFTKKIADQSFFSSIYQSEKFIRGPPALA